MFIFFSTYCGGQSPLNFFRLPYVTDWIWQVNKKRGGRFLRPRSQHRPSRSYALRGNVFHQTLCVLEKTICIGRRASSGLGLPWRKVPESVYSGYRPGLGQGYNAEHCNQIVLVAEVMIIPQFPFWGRVLMWIGIHVFAGGCEKNSSAFVTS